jgi:DNA invertase Pin-like site-specific DNA recombinase
MSTGKIVWQNYLAGDACENRGNCLPGADGRGNLRIERAVRSAIRKLAGPQREFIERYYFQGQKYSAIAKALGINRSKLERLHKNALRKLRKELAVFVRMEYGLSPETEPDCPICLSSERPEIDRLISQKREFETWRKIIRILKTDYQIIIKTPQILISHKEFHV